MISAASRLLDDQGSTPQRNQIDKAYQAGPVLEHEHCVDPHRHKISQELLRLTSDISAIRYSILTQVRTAL